MRIPEPSNGERRRVPAGPLLLIAVAVAATVALASVSARLTDIFGLTVAALVVTWLTRPLFCWFERRIGAAGAIVLTTLITFVVAFGFSGALFWDLGRGADGLATDIRQALETVDGRSILDRLVRALKLDDAAARYLDDLPANLVYGVNGEPAIGERIVDISIVGMLAAFLHASARTLLDGAVALWPRPERAQVRLLLADVDRTAGTYLRSVAVVGALWSLPFIGLAFATGLTMPVVIGMWAGFWMMVPKIGWMIGVTPVILAATIRPPVPGALAIAATVALGLIAWRVGRRLTPSLQPGIAVAVIGLSVGVAYSGTGAALLWYALAIVCVGVIRSPNLSGVRLPMPSYEEGKAYQWGPLVIPRGFTGVVMLASFVVLAVVAWSILGRIGSLVIWLVLAVLFAIALDRPTRFLQRRLRIPRLGALTGVFLTIAAIAAAIGWSIVNEGPTSAKKALDNLPKVVRQLEDAPVFGHWLRDANAAQVVTQWLGDLPHRVSRSRGQLSWLPPLSAQLAALASISLLTVALAVDGERIVDAVERRVHVRKRRQYRRVVEVSHRALAGYAAGSVLVCGINGAVVLILALVLQVGLAPVLALWAFLWDFVPQVGGFIGGLPLCVFALIAGPGPFVIATLVYIVYQLIESNVLFPAIIGEAIDIPAWAAMLAVLAGAAAAGVVGAVIVTPLVGVVRMLWVELRTNPVPGQIVTPQSPPAPAGSSG